DYCRGPDGVRVPRPSVACRLFLRRAAGARRGRLGDHGSRLRPDPAALWSADSQRSRSPCDRSRLHAVYRSIRVTVLDRTGRSVEGSRSGADAEGGARMKTVRESLSGKTARDENFPVASRLIAKRRRPIILAFYRFVRAADDVADNSDLSADAKLALLDHLTDALRGSAQDPEAEPLRLALRAQGIAPKHALDLLDAFRLDAVKNRYANLDELMDYCRLSAMPVGRFVLDAHGESRSLWPASDALCAALQVINHLQDCGEDYHRLDRVYLPQSILDAHGATVEMLAGRRASPQLRGAIAELARHAAALVEQGGEL